MPIGSVRNWKGKIVEAEKYDEPGSIYIHFFSAGQVRVVVTTWVGGAPEHPIPRPTKPAPFANGRSLKMINATSNKAPFPIDEFLKPSAHERALRSWN